MSEHTRRVVALVKDLFFTAKMENAARHTTYPVALEFARNAADLVQRVERSTPALVVLDLSVRGVDWTQTVAAVRAAAHSAPLTVLAFGPHTDKAGRAGARAAGCDVVVANSRFDRELPRLLERFSEPAAVSEPLMLDDEEAHP